MKKAELNLTGIVWFKMLMAALIVVVSARVEFLSGLALVWITPLALALRGVTKKQAVMLCATCSLIFWLMSIHWLLQPLITESEAGIFLASVILVVLCAWQTVPYIVLGYCYAHFRWDKQLAGPVLAAALLTVVWSYWPTLIPGLPQHSLYRYPQLIAVLDLSGTSGLLFLSTLLGFSIQYCLVRSNAHKKVYCALAIAIPVLMLLYGLLREKQYQAEMQQAGREQWLRVAYIQPSLIRPAPADRLYEMSEKIIRETSPDLLVWPEPSIVYSLIDREADRINTINLSRRYQQSMLIPSGYVYANDDRPGQIRTYYNRVHLLHDGKVAGEYSKQLLVPFFEYMPDSLGFLRKWMHGVLYYRAGKDQKPIAYSEHVNIAAMICYEVIFPSKVRELIQQGGNILVNPVSDTQFGTSQGSYYHMALAYFRSIENRVPFVRVGNTGVSIIVAADGRLIGQPTRLNEVTGNSADLFIPRERGLYSRLGDTLSFLLALFLVVYGIVYARRSDDRGVGCASRTKKCK